MPTRVADVFFGRVPAIHLLLLWACLASGSAEAQVASVHSQAELTAPIAIVDWTQLFGQIQGLDLILSPVQAVSSGDIAVELSVPPPAVGAPAYFRLRRQSQDLGDGISPIGGNFLPGDILLGSLADNLVGGPMTLVFDVPVFGFGAQIGPFDWSLAPPEQQPVACPGSTGCFSAVIEVFDDADNSLGSFAFDNLLSNTLADGSAPFIGVRSEAASIKRAVIRMSEPQSPFQIARLVMTSVPEPGALLLLTISVLAVLGPRPRRLGSACCTATIALAFGGSAQALVASVQSAQALGATQSLEWTQLYAQSLGFGLLLSPITAVSSAGTGVIATVPPPVAGATPFFRVRQQNFDIGGNFAPGEVLLGSLADNFIGGPMSFVFDVPVFGLGTQIGPFDWSLAPPEVQPVPCPASPGCFSATIEVFDGGGASLGVFVFDNLLSNTLADDSAPFIGVRSDIANIKRVVIGVGNGDPAFQISQLALIPSDPGPG